MKKILLYGSVFTLILAIVAIAVLSNELSNEKGKQAQPAPTQQTGEKSVAGIEYNPPSIEEVPDGPEKEAILRGHELVNNTSEVLRSEAASVEDGETAVNALSCSSCHAGAGLEEDSSSLVGMTAVYPEYISRSDQIVTIEERINGCMVRSMNGEPFAEDDEDLDAMVAYLQYISEGVPVNAELPWRKTNVMEDVPIPDVANGEELFQQSCIACHAQDGSGTGSNSGPALWGEGSFNDGAGLARMSNMAGYIQNNMPKGNEKSLDDQQAADLAAFVLSQDRPEFEKHDSDWAGGGRPSDSMTKERRDQVKDGTIDWEEVLGKK
ncbi:c-type cytochrome [Planococcus sp. APC 3906]|uniref:c-type cytochrome n=1 Tax=Planococcus sp. APC 3906 TaxID=3035194 RepID=UPI0025B4A501|nr:c-type cytochrome [Planococcus sp. APC 3906]MDN3450625.1 c-type cytochrome [Planococcus sp. APC 3906]